MKLLLRAILAAVLLAHVAAHAQEEVPTNAIWLLDLDGAVGPATSDYIVRGLDRAGDAEARLVVIRMDTPGGLDTAMRDIIEAILASRVAVATWSVQPEVI